MADWGNGHWEHLSTELLPVQSAALEYQYETAYARMQAAYREIEEGNP